MTECLKKQREIVGGMRGTGFCIWVGTTCILYCQGKMRKTLSGEYVE